jgi:tRNA(Arg) A34 adenosine deaminase TadA
VRVTLEVTEMDYLAEAIRLAEENVRSGGRPFASVVVRGDRIIASAVNRSAQRKDPTAHAEILAIRAAARALDSESLQGCAIYTTCEPCPMCLGALYWAELDQVVFAVSGEEARRFYPGVRRYHRAEDFYAQYALPFSQRRLPMQLEAREQGVRLFALWKTLN